MQQSDKLGATFFGLQIPGTFPTRRVKSYHNTNYAPPLDLNAVQSIYDWYKNAVENEGLPVARIPSTDIMSLNKTLTYIANNSGYSWQEVYNVLGTINDLVRAGELEGKYLTIQVPITSTKIQDQPAVMKQKITSMVNTPLSNIENTARWIGVAGVVILVGVGIYYTWPLLKKARKKF